MNKWAMPVLLFSLCAGSCADKVSPLTPAQKKARIDSLVKEREKEIREFEQDRLLDRISIEVKEKTDSILAERTKNTPQQTPLPPDTTHAPIAPTDTLNPATPR